MTTFNKSCSTNGRVPESWCSSWTHISVDRRSRGCCRVTFEHPPINTITATTVAEVAEFVGLIEQASDLNVVVFDSASHAAPRARRRSRRAAARRAEVRPQQRIIRDENRPRWTPATVVTHRPPADQA